MILGIKAWIAAGVAIAAVLLFLARGPWWVRDRLSRRRERQEQRQMSEAFNRLQHQASEETPDE